MDAGGRSPSRSPLPYQTSDANGNLLSGGNRTFTWNADNLPASVTSGGITESYTYDADGERVAKTVSGVTTVYFQGIWEQVVGGASKLYYSFNGQVVAMRDTSSNAVTYLHGDHLGSVSLATSSSGAVVSKQDFDPWGKARGTSTIAQTSLNYTGQRLDGTGLLYYHARYYDPVLARFVSADSVVPGNASGGMDGVALKGLTVDFHEPGFVAQLGGENGQAFWFQMSDEQRQQAGSPWGPANPQALDRYSYVQNNPLKYTDPSGHCIFALVDTIICIAVAVEVAEVVVTAVVGTVVIIGAYEAGGAIGRAQALAAKAKKENKVDGLPEDTPDTNPEHFENVRGRSGKKDTIARCINS
jgi:RHS repeat-associated protein